MQLATANETSPALPSAWIDRLFERLATMYGKHWFDQWVGVPIEEVKRTWREDLAFASGEQIRRALDHCKTGCKFPPTCPEFAGLCKDFAPQPETGAKRIGAPRGEEVPPYLRAGIREILAPKQGDHKEWARRILREHEDGTYRHLCGIDMAKRALGLTA